MIEQLLLYLNSMIEYTLFFLVFFSPKRRETIKNKWWKVLFIILTFGITFSLYNVSFIHSRAIWILVIWINYVFWILFEVRKKEIVLWGLGESLILTLFENIWALVLERYFDNENVFIIFTSISICLLWLFKKKLRGSLAKVSLKSWGYLDGILFLLTAMVMSCYVVFLHSLSKQNRNIGMAFLAGGNIAILILLFQLLYFYNSTMDFKMQKKLADMEAEHQKEYYQTLLEREEATKAFRHEVTNDLLQIKNKCIKQEYKDVEKYLDSMLNQVKKINDNYMVGNETVDVILNYYLPENSENNRVHVKGCIGDDIQVEPRDLCILIANLIRNAVEAVEKMQKGEIWIEVSQGEHYLLFSIRNTFVGKLLADPDGGFITSKKDKGSHGYGLKNIISIVEKYHGKYVFKAENQIYSADVWIEC